VPSQLTPNIGIKVPKDILEQLNDRDPNALLRQQARKFASNDPAPSTKVLDGSDRRFRKDRLSTTRG